MGHLTQDTPGVIGQDLQVAILIPVAIGPPLKGADGFPRGHCDFDPRPSGTLSVEGLVSACSVWQRESGSGRRPGGR
jgi:hypothetical protein